MQSDYDLAHNVPTLRHQPFEVLLKHRFPVKRVYTKPTVTDITATVSPETKAALERQ